MLTNNGDSGGLFRGAFMQSGAPIPVGNITRGQVRVAVNWCMSFAQRLEGMVRSNRQPNKLCRSR